MLLGKPVWNRVPVIIHAPITGTLVCLAGTIVWSTLIGLNLKFVPSLPWAVPVMAVFMWWYWRYLGGDGWPRASSESRRFRLRIRRLSAGVWAWALAAGVPAVAGAVTLQIIYARLARLPSAPLPDLSRYPSTTVLGALLMSAVVAGFIEEAAFRGYMQVPLERRFGPVAASGIVAIAFGLWHFSHGLAYTIPRLPYYFAISIIYSGIAYLTNSLLPTVAIHSCGDALEFVYLWLRGTPQPKPLAGLLRPYGEFWMLLGLAFFFGLLAIGAFRKLAAVSRRERLAVPAGRPGPNSMEERCEVQTQ